MVPQEPKLDRILHRHERILQKMFQKEDIDPKRHKYFLMEIDTPKIEFAIRKFKNKSNESNSGVFNLISVRPYNFKVVNDQKIFTDLFNLVLFSSPDPFRPITEKDAGEYFRDGTFLAFLYGKCVGYGVLTIEKTDQGKIGVIAGIGVHPKHRRKNIALKLALEMAEWFLKKDDLVKLQCEVYQKNRISYEFIVSFGFSKVGEFYLT